MQLNVASKPRRTLTDKLWLVYRNVFALSSPPSPSPTGPPLPYALMRGLYVLALSVTPAACICSHSASTFCYWPPLPYARTRELYVLASSVTPAACIC